MLLAVVLVAGLWTWRRQRSVDPALQRAALQLISVPQQTQRTVAELMGQGKEVQAIAALRRDAPVSLVQAREMVAQVDRGEQLPTPQQAAQRFREQFPELAGEVRELLQQGKEVQAIKRLRQQLPVDLRAARNLVAALRSGQER